MSLLHLNSPPLVAMAGASIAVGLPALNAALSTPSASLLFLRSLNVAAFVTSVLTVSVPGRLDGARDDEMRSGNLNPAATPSSVTAPGQEGEGSSLVEKEDPSSSAAPYSLCPGRTLVNPAGWAFAIWGPIYLGEAAFAAAAALAPDAAAAALLPRTTAPFVAATLFQSLWCAAFRPSYGAGWHRYISAALLGGTAYSLSLVQAAGSAAAAAHPSVLSRLLLPLTVHFGWTSAAALVNLNGARAADGAASPRSLIALGNASALVAAALGVGLTLSRSAPAYGLTLAWALAACADGMSKRVPSPYQSEEETLAKGARVQKYLCWAGSFACAVAASYAGLF